MASNVEDLLDRLYEMVDEAKNVPLSPDKFMLERDRVLEHIEEIKNLFPQELNEAKKLLSRRSEFIAAAKREAEHIRKGADSDAARSIAESTILSEAKKRADELMLKAETKSRDMIAQAQAQSKDLMEQAESRSKELKQSATEYCEDALRRTELAIGQAFDEVKNSRSEFRLVAKSFDTDFAPPQTSARFYDVENEEY